MGPRVRTWLHELKPRIRNACPSIFHTFTLEYQSVHQATNSLRITLCERKESCIPDNENTFIFTIFQHKTYRNFHAVYEPYEMAFRQTAPFEVYGISRRPFWILGREKLPDDGSEMFYITSISWKSKRQHYHGLWMIPFFLALVLRIGRWVH